MNYEMIKYNIVVCCYGKILVNVGAYVIPSFTPHTQNEELHKQPHLPRFYHNITLLYCILSFHNS